MRLLSVVTVIVLLVVLNGCFSPISSKPTVVPIDQLELALKEKNIILSGPTPQDVDRVRQYIRDDPAYQRLSRNILNILAGKQIINREPLVRLDIINGKYKKIVNPEDPETPLPVDRYDQEGSLKQAIYEAWKDFHQADPENAFDEIVETETS